MNAITRVPPGACAQRLTASEVKAYLAQALEQGLIRVLNALRHQR